MTAFGWAYVDCSGSGGGGGGGQAAGPTGSVQFLTGSNATNGTGDFTYNTSSTTLFLTGTLIVSGNISASSYTIKDITHIGASGSTKFGDTNDDTHIRTGSMYIGQASSTPVFTVDVATSQTSHLGVRVGYRSIAAAGLTSSNSDYVLGFGGSGDIEFRIHSASDAGAGAVLLIKDELSARVGCICLSSSGGETIDGGTFYDLTGSSPAISLYSNGSNWFVF